ncbi:MAG: hypothetical protein JWO52_7052 [Gammaproteobacteria bacterium]|nr:hypothetical protein [Gammaproteobacteria bacterium]
MRLIDQVGQSVNPLIVQRATDKEPLRLPSACDWAREVLACPVRYVLDDHLVRMCTELAFSDGHRLASCLDLIHLPDTTLWVEWNDAARQNALASARTLPGERIPRGSADSGSAPDYRMYRAGVLLTATGDGRRGSFRTFWSEGDGHDPSLAPLVTHVDLDRDWGAADSLEAVFDGGWARLHDPEDPSVDALLDCLRFRFDPAWAAYYRGSVTRADDQSQVLRGSIGTVSRDTPMLLAFFLLLNSCSGLPQRSVDWSRLNRKRVASGRAPLLNHIEVRVPLERVPDRAPAGDDTMMRSAPIRHPVRGHLFRRGNDIKWRKKHWRGSVVRGRVESRTVTFSFGRESPRS